MHDVHVSKNAVTGQLEGLPVAWKRQLDNQFSRSEQHEHPGAVLQAIKYYNYAIKQNDSKSDQELLICKPIVTEQLLQIESKEIERNTLLGILIWVLCGCLNTFHLKGHQLKAIYNRQKQIHPKIDYNLFFFR